MATVLQFQQNQREVEYEGIKEKLREIAGRRREDGKRIIQLLWDIYSHKYWEIEEGYEGNEEESGWLKYCDEVIAPYFEGDDYFNDFPRIMESVLKFVHEKAHTEQPITHPVTQKVITVEELIQRPGMIGKLITASQKAGYCGEEDKIELVKSMVTGTREDVRAVGERAQKKLTPITINYTIQINADGTVDYVFRQLDTNASKLFNRVIENSLGKTALELHLI